MYSTGYRESYWERHPGQAVVLIVLAVVALIGGCWFGWVKLSDPVGAGNTEIKNNSVQNRTGAQAEILDEYQAVQRNMQIAKDAAELSAKRPNDKQHETDAIGARQICITSVTTYNATTHKTLFQDWKDADLPWNIDPAGCQFKFNADGTYIQG